MEFLVYSFREGLRVEGSGVSFTRGASRVWGGVGLRFCGLGRAA